MAWYTKWSSYMDMVVYDDNYCIMIADYAVVIGDYRVCI